MKVTYLSEYDPADPDELSGTPYWIAKGLSAEVDLQTTYIDVPAKLLPPLEELAFRAKQQRIRFYQRAHLDPDLLLRRAWYIAKSIQPVIENAQSDVILSALSPVATAFLSTKRPIVFWTDALYAGLIATYPGFRYHHPDTMVDAHHLTEACLTNAKLLIFSSSWAQRTAIECYGITKEKTHVVPFGANLLIEHSYDDIKTMLAARSTTTIHLLFVAKEWHRKGGDIVLNIAAALVEQGYQVQLTMVGYAVKEKLPSYISCVPPLSKKHSEKIAQLKQYYREAHFLLMPSRAEAFGIVFCEANAFGVPCLATHVGGISDVIKDGINGKTFPLEASIATYCDYISYLFTHPHEYRELALSAYQEYQSRLNWGVASKQVRTLLESIC